MTKRMNFEMREQESNNSNEYNYVFVSDLHVSVGKNPEKNTYSRREDFFYDEEFAGFLRYMDTLRRDPDETEFIKPWELVIVGDCFDFLPVTLYKLDQAKNIKWLINELSGSLNWREPNEPLNWREPNEPLNWREILRRLANFFNSRKARSPVNGFPNIRYPDEYIIDLLSLIQQQEVIEHIVGHEILDIEVIEVSEVYQYVTEHFPNDPNLDDDSKVFVKYAMCSNCYPSQLPQLVTKIYFDLKVRNKEIKNHLDYFYFLKQIKPRDPDFWNDTKKQLNYSESKLLYSSLTEPNLVLDKLEMIYLGHQVFFDALTNWVSAGNKIAFISGNHDQEISIPDIQQYIRRLIAWGDWELENKIDFYEWFYFKKGLFYAEHGDQYDNSNCSPNPIFFSLRKYSPKDKLIPAWGSLLVATIISELEDYLPDWENQAGHATVVFTFLRNHPWKMSRLLVRNAHLLIRLYWSLLCDYSIGKVKDADFVRYAQKLGMDTEFQKYNKYLETKVQAEALLKKVYLSRDEPIMNYWWFRWFGFILIGLFTWLGEFPRLLSGLLPEWAAKLLINALSLGILTPLITPVFQQDSLLRIVWSGWFQPLFITLSVLVFLPIILIILILLIILLIGAFTACINQDKKFAQSFRYSKDYVLEGAKGVKDIFNKSLSDERLPMLPGFIIMGHDHRPRMKKLNYTDKVNRYLCTYYNTGSWLPALSKTGERQLRSQGNTEFTFLTLREKNDGQRERNDEQELVPGSRNFISEFWIWNDSKGCIQPQITFEEPLNDHHDDLISKIVSKIMFLFCKSITGIRRLFSRFSSH